MANQLVICRNMGGNRVDETNYSSMSFLMKRKKICEKGFLSQKACDKGEESIGCECRLSGDTFPGWKVNASSIGKTLDWESRLFSHPGSATEFPGELRK